MIYSVHFFPFYFTCTYNNGLDLNCVSLGTQCSFIKPIIFINFIYLFIYCFLLLNTLAGSLHLLESLSSGNSSGSSRRRGSSCSLHLALYGARDSTGAVAGLGHQGVQRLGLRVVAQVKLLQLGVQLLLLRPPGHLTPPLVVGG